MERREIVLVLGKTGNGKTTLAKEIRAKSSRIITIDPLHEYDGRIVFSFPEAFDRFQALEAAGENNFSLTCRFSDDIDTEYMFRLVKSSAYARDMLLVLEEAELYVEPRSMDENFKWLVNYGRHKSVSLLCIARRVPELSPSFRAQATSIITFKQEEPIDLEYMEQYGFNIEQVASLPPHEYIYKGKSPEELFKFDA